MDKTKPKLEAKIVKHAHRKRFYEYLRDKKQTKFTLSHIYWYMFLRSGKGNVFHLADEWAAADMGIGVNVLRDTRRILMKDGWVTKLPARRVPDWTVNTSQSGTQEVGIQQLGAQELGTQESGTAVVLHPQDAFASTPHSTPSASTPSVAVSERVSSLRLSQDEEQEQNLRGFEAEENPNPITDIGEDDDEEYVITHTDEEVLAELGKCFPVFKSQVKPKPEEIALFREILTKCDDWMMYPSDAMAYARKHKQAKPGLIPSSVQRLWDATCADDISSTNSLLAQTKAHKPQDCLICKMAIKNVMCARCGKFTVFYKPDGTVSSVCLECNKLPTYRLESGQRQIMRNDY